MDIIRSILVMLFLVFLFSTQNIMFSLGMNIICKESERTALLSFKKHLKNSSRSLSSWSGENCCRWIGVVCHNRTHHVIQLHLQNLWLGGELNPSLLELKQLTHLDLSSNYFEGISIPDFVGSLQSLTYLNLSNADFNGTVPHQFRNLSRLQYLDIRSTVSINGHEIFVGNFQWFSHLASLQYLDMSGVQLQNASNWFHVVNMLPSLLVLRLSACDLSGAFPSLPYVNFTSLAVLALFGNNLNSTLPEWLYNLTDLKQLDLRDNSFQGTISASIGNLTKLTFLDLSNNQFSGALPDELGRLQNLEYLSLRGNSFSGSIPFSIGRLTLLTHLDLSYNELNGSVPKSVGNLWKLETLLLSHNALEGIVSDILLSNLTRLSTIKIHSLVLKVSPEWIPPFQLRIAHLRNCELGPRFPNWIQTQKLLSDLDLSSNGISGMVPTWLWNLSSQFYYMNLSQNHFNGQLPKVLKGPTSATMFLGIFLSSNQFKGPLPRLDSSIDMLDLSNNSISGPISALLCNPFTEVNGLEVLDLSNNLLSGDLSQCWFYWKQLTSINLGNNNITGKIPNSMVFAQSMGELSISSLLYLHLQNNSLSGELPLFLKQNSTSLRTIDIGDNMLTGKLPIWFGESLPSLILLRLRRNKFHGEIPQKLCYMASLQMLDLAHNKLSGPIPRCFNNFTAMVTEQNEQYESAEGFFQVDDDLIIETTSLVTKGRESEYGSIFRLVTNMDLSKNNLSGEIPEELASLIGLRFLNLSENHFIGKIPENIGNMSLLESLDFSNNNISSVIPQSISRLTFLSYLNLSHNNLSGKIPSSSQLQGFNESSFTGNRDLCGLPLKKCRGEDPPQKPGDIGDREVDEEALFEMKWFYISMGVGLVVGFWTFCGVMVFQRSWRIAHLQFLDNMKDKLCILF